MIHDGSVGKSVGENRKAENQLWVPILYTVNDVGWVTIEKQKNIGFLLHSMKPK